MRRLATVILLALLASPLAADWTINASTATWHEDRPLALVQEARDAILWHRTRQPLQGAIFTAALPSLTVSDLGGGQGRVSIAMGRAAFDSWSAATVAVICPEAATNQEKLDCLDAAILADLRGLVYSYRHHLREQSNPVVEPEL